MQKTNLNSNEEWWEAVWKSLVMDGSGAHCKKMGNAIWLFLYLLLHADCETGKLVRKVKVIASEIGIPIRTITRWLALLKKEGYIQTRNTGHSLEIVVSLWKTLWKTFHDKPEPSHQMSHQSVTRKDKSGNCGKPDLEKEGAKITEISKNGCLPIDTENLLNKLKIDTDEAVDNPPKDPKRERHIAYDLAQGLNDLQNFPLYLSYARKYPEPFLRKILALVLDVPPEKINKSRGALFNYLAQKYATNSTNHPGD